MNSYELKQQARKERLERAAVRAAERSDADYIRARQMQDVVPFGQPILIGHHSEKRHRSLIKKTSGLMDRSVAEWKASKTYAEKAAAVGTAGISSDDPDAVKKLKDKLAALEQNHAVLKAMPRAERQWYTLPYSSRAIAEVKKRIARLEKRPTENKAIERFGYEEKHNAEENRVQLLFTHKPVEETRKMLKYYGFRWAPSQKAWQRQLNNAGIYAAGQFAKWMEDQINA